jgi:hypothetical protein
VDPANIRDNAAGLALIPCPRLSEEEDRVKTVLREGLKDKVTFIVYHNSDKAGSFGEKRVLTAEDGELRRCALLGTEEGDAALKEFALKAASKSDRARGLLDDDEEEDDM